MSTIEDVKTRCFKKALRKFTEEPVVRRVEILIQKLSTREEVLLTKRYSDEAIKKELSGWGTDTLIGISDERNSIVRETTRAGRLFEELKSVKGNGNEDECRHVYSVS